MEALEANMTETTPTMPIEKLRTTRVKIVATEKITLKKIVRTAARIVKPFGPSLSLPRAAASLSS
jgi:hypothetical protein